MGRYLFLDQHADGLVPACNACQNVGPDSHGKQINRGCTLG
jgi:hypothetical protein